MQDQSASWLTIQTWFQHNPALWQGFKNRKVLLSAVPLAPKSAKHIEARGLSHGVLQMQKESVAGGVMQLVDYFPARPSPS